MASHMDGISVTFKGMPVYVQSCDVQASAIDRTTRVTIDGFLTDEAQLHHERMRERMYYPEHAVGHGSGSGVGVSSDYFLSTPIGGYTRQDKTWDDYKSDPIADIKASMNKMLMGGEKMREGTQGSYAYGVAQLAEGLSKACEAGWITDEEAKTEMRANIATTESIDRIAKYEADRIEALEKELEELKAEKN